MGLLEKFPEPCALCNLMMFVPNEQAEIKLVCQEGED